MGALGIDGLLIDGGNAGLSLSTSTDLLGLELGAGIVWHDPQHGISAELRGRSLVAHVEEESGSRAWPSPSPGTPPHPIAGRPSR